MPKILTCFSFGLAILLVEVTPYRIKNFPYTKESAAVGERVKNYNPGNDKVNPNELGCGDYYQCDIILPEETYKAANGLSLRKFADRRWPNGIVPYVVYGKFNSTETALIQKAMQMFADVSCVRFVPRTVEEIYIKVQSNATGCNSFLGRYYTKSEASNILNFQTPNCFSRYGGIGTMLHEMMHTLGFHHEHVRPDRDNYIKINRAAIASQYNTDSWYKTNLEVLPAEDSETYGLPYNYASIMHYSRFAGAADHKTPVMDNIKPWDGDDFGSPTGFHPQDIKLINYMYCNKTG